MITPSHPMKSTQGWGETIEASFNKTTSKHQASYLTPLKIKVSRWIRLTRPREPLTQPLIVNPPDTLMVCPVMNEASSLRKKATNPG